MSDESQPPQLRLRPRKRDDEPTAVPTPTPPPAAEPPAGAPPVEPSVSAAAPAADTSARFRLKPKLAQDPEATALPEKPLVSPPPPPPAPAVHTLPPVVPHEVPGEMPRLKLKPLTSISAPPPSVESPAVAPPPVPLPTTPPFPVGAPVVPPMSDAGSVPPPPLAIGGPPLVVPSTVPIPQPVVPPPPVVLHTPVKPAGVAAKKKKPPLAALLGLLVAVVGVTAYFLFLRPASHAPAAAPAPVVVKPAAPAHTPEPVVIAPLPPPPSLNSSVTISTTTNSAPAVPVVSPQFRSWIENARVTGVITGASPKAIINGRLARPGDMIDAGEGIVLDAINADQKLLVFRNRSGATASKPY